MTHLGSALHELDRHALARLDVLHELAHAERSAAHIPDLRPLHPRSVSDAQARRSKLHAVQRRSRQIPSTCLYLRCAITPCTD